MPARTSTLALGVADRLRRIADRLDPPFDRDPTPSEALLVRVAGRWELNQRCGRADPGE